MIYTSDNYRNFVAETIYRLNQLTESLDEMLVNMLMFGEMEGINGTFETGDSFEFFPQHFEGSNDENLNLVLKTIKKVTKISKTFEKLNNMEEDEVLSRLIEKFGDLPD